MAPVALPRSAQAEVAAQQQRACPRPVVGRVLYITEPDIGDPPATADLSRARRGLHGGNGQSSLLQVQRRPTSPSPQIQNWAMLNERQQFAIPPVPSLDTAEEPFRGHGGPSLAAFYLQDKLGYVLALQVVEQSGPESVMRGIDHGLIVVM